MTGGSENFRRENRFARTAAKVENFHVSALDHEGNLLGVVEQLETHLSARRDPLSTTVYRAKLLGAATPAASTLKPREPFLIEARLKLLRDDAGLLARSSVPPAALESVQRTSIIF